MHFQGLPWVLGLVVPAVLLRAGGPGNPGPLFEACGKDPYYFGKAGFRSARDAVHHADREFRRRLRAGDLDPRRDEYFSYVCTWQAPGQGILYFHTPWNPAQFEGYQGGSLVHRLVCPLAVTDRLKVYTFIHSHPTALPGGEGPSRVDVATASRYKEADGTYRYLYLINSRGVLIRFKARRDCDPTHPEALARLPLKPKKPLDWLD